MVNGRSNDGPTHVEAFRAAQKAAREAAGLPVQDDPQPATAPEDIHTIVWPPVAAPHGTPSVPPIGVVRRPVIKGYAENENGTGGRRPRKRKKTRRRIVRVRRPARARRAKSPWGFFFGVVVFCAALITGIAGGLPVLGHGASLGFCGGGVVVALLAAVWVWQRRDVVKRKTLALSAVCAALLVVLFFLGASTSVVLNGKVYAVTSVTARSWHLSHQMVSQLQLISQYNVVLGYPYAEGEAHYDELATGISSLQTLVNEWANPNGGDVPNYRFIAAATDLDAAAAYGVSALTDQQQYLSTDDTDSQSLAAAARVNMDENAQAALKSLQKIARHYHFTLKASL